jgi:type II secretory ATPase GspE/PulE/Tfp pilus assembly ATPase PilB-like protein
VRCICKKCSTPDHLPTDVQKSYGLTSDVVPKIGKGCDECEHSGYRGRTGIFELLVTNDEFRAAVLLRRSGSELHALAVKAGMQSLRESAFERVKAGMTSLAEAMSVVGDGR